MKAHVENQQKDISLSQIRLRSPKCRVHALLITSQSALFVYSLSNNARYFAKKKCKVVLAGELRDLRDYKIAKWAFKNLGKKVSAIGIKYTVLFFWYLHEFTRQENSNFPSAVYQMLI